MKKFMAIMLALVLVLGMTSTAFAEEASTGKITITNASVGQTYTAYKIFDATYNPSTKTTSYSVATEALATLVENATVDGTDLFTVADTADSEGRYAVQHNENVTAAQITTWIQAELAKTPATFTQAADPVTPTEGNVVTFDVPYGYYYITSTLGTTVTIDTNTPEVEVRDKNVNGPSFPEDMKQIVTDENTKVSSSTAKIGDEVDFVVAFTATNYEDATSDKVITNYSIVDDPTAMDVDTSTIVVTLGEGETADVLTLNTEYTVTEAADGTVTINIPWATQTAGADTEATDDDVYKSIYQSPIKVTVTYTAVVTKDVVDTTGTKAGNSVTIKYNDKTSTADTTDVETYEFTLSKTDGTNQLTGAQFELYDGNTTDANKIDVVWVETKAATDTTPAEGYYRVAESTETGVAIEAGQVVVKGLKGGATYYLKEIKAPDGYNLKTDLTSVTISTTAANEVTVVNQSGSELPETGGMGTTIFYVVGGMMMAAAFVLLITKRKVAAEK